MDLVNFYVMEMTEKDRTLTHATLIDNPSLSPDRGGCQFLVSIWCRANVASNVQTSDNGLFERVNTEDRDICCWW